LIRFCLIYGRISRIIGSERFRDRHRTSEQAFTRDRKLPLPLLVTFLLNQVQGAVQSELDRFFQVLHSKTVALREVSAAALTKARRKLSHTAFIELNRCLMASTAEALPLRRWHGLRLLAVDGSKLRLPNLPVMRKQFGVGTNGNKETPVAMALLSTLYDVLNHVTVDVQVDRYDASERDLALAHLGAIGPGSLVVFDRGYPAFWLFAAMQARGIDFCVRVPWNFYKECETLVIRGLRENMMTLKPTAEAQRQCRALGLPTEPLNLRLVRVVLDSGEPEVLVTSLLDTSAFPAAEFKRLYHLRWPVEICQSWCLLTSVFASAVRAVHRPPAGAWPSAWAPCAAS
jgi:hypothetical protein